MSDKRPPDRRDFLTGRAAGQVAADALKKAGEYMAEAADVLAPRGAVATEADAAYVVKLTRRAMSCDFEVRINADRITGDLQTAAALQALDLVDDIESQLTVYREVSEVLDINAQAAGDWVRVETGLFGLLELADKLHRDTNGAFDLTGGPLSRVWGFDIRQGRLPSPQEITAAKQHIGWWQVQLDSETSAIRFENRELEINLNSMGKGYALDRAGQLLREEGVSNFLLHGGRSTLLASGKRKGETGWTARVRHPLRPQQVVAEFVLEGEALSTSGSATQSFILGSRRYGHLIDPRTGWPADSMHSAVVVAPSGALADGLSTAFYVMGEDEVASYCEQHPEIKALLVLPAVGNSDIRVRTFNIEPAATNGYRTDV